jgi:serine/threonine protein kinase
VNDLSAVGTDAMNGRRLGGRYLLGIRLGGGGMAIVYRAVDARLHREVAVKVLDAMRGADAEQRARFEIEARAAASITHPNVVAVHDVGIEGDPPNVVPYIVMECLPGRTLADEVRTGPLSAARATAVLDDVLAALGAAHAKGVLHRDIKPSNVLLDEDGRVKLADFGIARVAPGDLTITGMVMGTPAYLAPERVAGRPATVESDLYAVGVLGYEALAGVRPFVGDSPLALAHAIHAGNPRSLSEMRPDLPAALAAPIMRALSTDPVARPQSAADMRRELDGGATIASDATEPSVSVADATPTDVLPATPKLSSTPRPSARRTRRLAVAVLLAAVLVGLAAGTIWSITRDDGNGNGSGAVVTTTVPAPAVPAPLRAPFEQLEHSVQP